MTPMEKPKAWRDRQPQLIPNPPLDPEINLYPRHVVDGIANADAEFESKRADFYLLLRALANVVYRARLDTGGRLTDASDFKRWLEQLAEAVK
jgi:hypothetical protein